MEELERWLAESYTQSFRTACLILRNRADAEEAVQEAFLRAWRFRAAVRDEANVPAWLYRVLVNACCTRLRKEQSLRARLDGAADEKLDELAADEPSPEARASDAVAAGTVDRAVAALPEHLRIPVVLRYFSGLSEQEIALAIHRRPGTVKSRLHEARRRLAADPTLGALVAVEGGTS